MLNLQYILCEVTTNVCFLFSSDIFESKCQIESFVFWYHLIKNGIKSSFLISGGWGSKPLLKTSSFAIDWNPICGENVLHFILNSINDCCCLRMDYYSSTFLHNISLSTSQEVEKTQFSDYFELITTTTTNKYKIVKKGDKKKEFVFFFSFSTLLSFEISIISHFPVRRECRMNGVANFKNQLYRNQVWNPLNPMQTMRESQIDLCSPWNF